MTVIESLTYVMRDVQSIAKNNRNASQGFNFRGIDDTINAVGPALREHGVVIVPEAQEIVSEQYETKNKTIMRNVVVKIGWRIYGPEMDSITACTYGEAADSGDKAVSKAHSVAYRTALLQTLCIPTDDQDPDSITHERTTQAAPAQDRQPPRTPPPAPSRAQAWAQLWDASIKVEPDLDQDARQTYILGELQEHKLDGGNVADLLKAATALTKIAEQQGAPA